VVAGMSAQQNEKTQRYALAEVDDLTHFAEESFSTDQVDLFDIGGGEESPLARLKTIVLSLDWEISEGNLRDLSDEARQLRQTLAGNPLADIYLQGLDKMSRYIQTAQSNTHPNAIKLLQIYYCDLERLCAATPPWPEDILAMVREDVRRFRILGTQVGSRHSSAQAVTAGLRELESVAAAQLHRLKGLVLGIDWEVTDKVLEELEQEVGRLRGEGIGGHLVGLVLSAMDALARYMRQAGSRTHAAAYSVLYALCNGVEQLLERPDMPEPEAEDLVLELGERFEGLKQAVLRKQQEAGDRRQEEEARGQEAADRRETAGDVPVAVAVAAARTMEISREEPGPAFALADTEVLTLDLDGSDDDYLDITTVQGPALEGVASPEPESPAPASDATPDSLTLELDERLESFFGADGASTGPVVEVVPALAAVSPVVDEPGAAPVASSEDSLVLDLEDRLDSFFGADDASTGPAVEVAPALAAVSPAEDEPGATPAVSSDDSLVLDLEERLESFFGADDASTGPAPAAVPALAESPVGDDAAAPSAPTSDESRMLELDDRLEAFFGAADGAAAPPATEDSGALASAAALSAAAAVEADVLRLESDQPTSGEDEGDQPPTLMLEGPEAEFALLGDELSALDSPPSEEQVRQWQGQITELLRQLSSEDGRRLPLLLLDTVLAALPGQVDKTASLAVLLGALGRELAMVVASAAPVEAMPPLEQYLAWQREVNRGLAGRASVAP